MPKKRPRFSSQDEGVFVDCHQGIYVGEEVIAIARANGWNWRKAGYKVKDLKADQCELYHEAWSDAEDFLNRLAPEGFYFGTMEGCPCWGLFRIPEEETE